MATAAELRRNAWSIVTRAVDLAAPDTYHEIGARKALYQRLITEHNIQYLTQGQSKTTAGRPRNLTVERFGEVVKYLVAAGGTTVAKFFHNGSGAFSQKFLESFGYISPSTEAQQGSVAASRAQNSNVPSGSKAPSAGATSGYARQEDQVGRASPKIHLKNSQSKAQANASGAVNTSSSDQTMRGKRTREDGDVGDKPDSRPSKVSRVAESSPEWVPSETDSGSDAAQPGAQVSLKKAGKRKVREDGEDTSATRQAKFARPTLSNEQTRVPGSAHPAPTPTVSNPDGPSARTAGGHPSAPPVENSSGQGQTAAAGQKREHSQIEAGDADLGTVPVHPLIPKGPRSAFTQPYKKRKTLDLKAPSPSDEKDIRSACENDPLGPHGYQMPRLSGKEATDSMLSIASDIRVAVTFILGRENVMSSERAEFVDNPQPELKALYAAFLGKNWREKVATLGQTRDMAAVHLLEGCIAAAVHKWVYEQPVSWQTPRDLIEELHSRHQLFAFNTYFREFHEGKGSIQHAIWQMGISQTNDPDFRKHTILPIAKDLARKVLAVIQPQVALSLRTPVPLEKAEQSTSQAMRRLTDAFKEALLLQAKMKASPGYHVPDWVLPDTDFDIECMVDDFAAERYGPPVPKKVLWSISPQILYREYAGHETTCFAPAKVVAAKTNAAA